MKFSILMPYMNRLPQLRKTLQTFEELYAFRNDFEVIVMLDPKETEESEQQVRQVCSDFMKMALCFRSEWSSQINSPGPLYNEAARLACGDYLILTSPEVYHANDILGGLDEHFEKDPSVYVVCSVAAARPDGKVYRWYQHTEHRNSLYHFCSAIDKTLYEDVGGFDERFAAGVGYDDNDFRDAVIVHGIEIVPDDILLAVHQEHAKLGSRTPRRKQLTLQNRALYVERCKERGMEVREN